MLMVFYFMMFALCWCRSSLTFVCSLSQIACDNNDPEMSDFIEREFLAEQVEAIKKISGYVAQLRRVGKGHGKNTASIFC